MTILNGASLRDWAAEALDDALWALPEAVIEDAPEGLDQLQAAQRSWARRNSCVGDAFAREVGLL